MKNNTHFGMKSLPLAFSLLLFLAFTHDSVYAHGNPFAAIEKQNKAGLGVMAVRRLTEVNLLLEDDLYGESLVKLEEMVADDGWSDYESAVIWHTVGYVYNSIENYEKAVVAYKSGLDLGVLPEMVEEELLNNIGQLYIQLERYREGIEMLEAWVKTAEEVPAHIDLLLGMAYYYEKNSTKARHYLKRSLEKTSEPSKSTLQILAGIDVEAKEFVSAIDWLDKGVAYFPKEKYFWIQMGNVYRLMEDHKRATGILAMANDAGLLNVDESKYLAQLYRFVGAPIKAAKIAEDVLQKQKVEGNSWHLLLADSWLQAKEWGKAASAYEHAGSIGESGEPFVRHAEIAIQNEDWETALRSLIRALDKGNLKDPGRVTLLAGVAHVQLEDYSAAIKILKKAALYEDAQASAQKWIQQTQLLQEEKNL